MEDSGKVKSPVELAAFKKKVQKVALQVALSVIYLGLEGTGRFSWEGDEIMTAKQLRALTALLLALVMILSISFIALNADHDCCGEDCRICAQIRACEELLHDLLPVAAVLLAAWGVSSPGTVPSADTAVFACPHTLITLKVKLSD